MEVDESPSSSTAMAKRGSRNVTAKLMAKLKRALDERNFYESHQIYRTIYVRTCSAEKLDEVLSMLHSGATYLLQNHQLESGADLAMLYLDAIEKHLGEIPADKMDVVAELHHCIAKGTQERQNFLAKALKLSIKGRPGAVSGSPVLHAKIATNLWKEKDYVAARYHFLRSRDSMNFATMLVEVHVLQGYAHEVDLFIAQSVFQYLCLMKDSDLAQSMLTAYCETHPELQRHKGPPYKIPLLNFVWHLLVSISVKRLNYFHILRSKYQPVLDRDPSYLDYLDRIAQIFFDVRPPQNPQRGGLFGNFFNSLMENFCDSDESDMQGPAEAAASNSHPSPQPDVADEELD
ncbi:unnamed protein product [Notodromas monacha]|uniref:Golgi to ER traffic protein 4 homolog n=1 Tax=Notodromas monacha TaxID=399045 RepID=A0A7R9BRY1_9CRUS|nr:unnamed protein product [Notodromas monacha]CAG0920583.1 unnamed protein product [Notodromas monacha]